MYDLGLPSAVATCDDLVRQSNTTHDLTEFASGYSSPNVNPFIIGIDLQSKLQ